VVMGEEDVVEEDIVEEDMVAGIVAGMVEHA
jgi:hypothetical protein